MVSLHVLPYVLTSVQRSYLICVTLGPAFLSASIYLSLSRIVVVYGEDISRFRPATYTLIFIGADIVSLVLQSIGGGMSAEAATPAATKTGVNIMTAGLAFQVFALVLFIAMCSEYAFRVSRRTTALNPVCDALRQSRKFKAFLVCEYLFSLRVPRWAVADFSHSDCSRDDLHPCALCLPSCRTQ